MDFNTDKGFSSYRKSFNPYYKKKEENEQPQAPILNSIVLNFNKVGMDNLYTFHQENHSEKTFPLLHRLIYKKLNKRNNNIIYRSHDSQQKPYADM